jgi:hypothetical protein
MGVIFFGISTKGACISFGGDAGIAVSDAVVIFGACSGLPSLLACGAGFSELCATSPACPEAGSSAGFPAATGALAAGAEDTGGGDM